MESRDPRSTVAPCALGFLRWALATRMNSDGQMTGFQPRSDPGLSFPRGDVASVREDPEEDALDVQLRFGSLFGAASPCPDYLLDLISLQGGADADSDAERPLIDFLEIFNARLMQLFLAAAVKHDLPFHSREDATDVASGILLALSGLTKCRWLKSLSMEPREMLRYTAAFSMWPHSARGLEGLLCDYFDSIDFVVETNVQSSYRVPEGRRNQLGVQNTTLTDNFTIGEWIPDVMSRFRVHVGPLTYPEFRSFLPTAVRRDEMIRLARLYSPPQLVFDSVLHIRGTEIPTLFLSAEGDARLGWTTWLVSLTRGDDAVVFAGTGASS